VNGNNKYQGDDHKREAEVSEWVEKDNVHESEAESELEVESKNNPLS
jgi:hypothetical protein